MTRKAKLTKQQVKEIRDSKDTYESLCEKYGVSVMTIYKAKKMLIPYNFEDIDVTADVPQ